ncbi:MAG TPA: TolC family protein [Acetobacteraceae bacterium]|nr:TolC family protein [Acetobacteraceae bacterium]
MSAGVPARRDGACSRVPLLVAAMLALAGCDLAAPPATVETVRKALPARTVIPPTWASAAPDGNVADNWLAGLHDPRLNAIVAEAIANNTDLRAAAARVTEAQQKVVVIGAQLLPQVGAEAAVHATLADRYATIDGSHGGTIFSNNAESVGISWEIDVWGRLRAQRAASQASYQAVALDYAFARQSLAATAVKSWFQAVEAWQLLDLTGQSVGIYANLLALVKLRRSAGKVADLDVAEAEGSLDTARSDRTKAEGVYSEAKRNLEVLLGRYPGAEIEVAQHFAPVAADVPAGLPFALLSRRPDVIAAEREVLAAFRLQEAARLALLPSFSLALDGGHLADGLLALLRLNPWLLHAALGVSVPIYTGGALQAQIAIATAAQLQATAQYGSVLLHSFREVEAALTNERLLGQQLDSELGSLRANTEAVRIGRIKYVDGSIDMLSLLQLEQRQIATEAEVIQLRSARLENLVNLYLALGASFDAMSATATTGSPEPGAPPGASAVAK